MLPLQVASCLSPHQLEFGKPAKFEMTKRSKLLQGLSICLLLTAALAPSVAKPDDSPWTTRPVRIDRSKQDYERLPPAAAATQKREEEERRFVMRLPQQITMQDSATFRAGGKTFILAGIDPVPGDKICTSETGSRWPCGRRAAVFSGKLLSRQLLRCALAVRTPDDIRLTDCSVGQKNVQAEILANGQAFASSESAELADVMEKARQARKGVWRDKACFKQDGNC